MSDGEKSDVEESGGRQAGDEASAGDRQKKEDQEKQEREGEEAKEQARKGRAGILAFGAFLLLVCVVLVVVTLAEGWDRVFASRVDPQAEDAYAWGSERPVDARVAGYVTDIFVDDNEDVVAGEPIAQLESDNYQAEVDAAGAALAAAQATLASLQAEHDAAVENVAASGAIAQATHAQQNYADQQAGRQNRILPTDLGLLRSAQRATADARGLTARTAAQQEDTVASKESVRAVDAEIVLQRADIELARARLARAELDLSYTTVRAPAAGELGVRQVHVGDLVGVGTQVIPLTPLGDVWVFAYFKETQMTHVRIGQEVSVRFDAWPNTLLLGHVDQIGPLTLQQRALPMPDNTTGNYTKVVQRVPVKIVLAADNVLRNRVRPGMSALVRVRTNAPVGVVTAR